ncbi:hypothetical protein O3G_MSEX014577 [Manduca sexta]|uniref:NACHT domain-containing protein n=1 Tax=Manduca sexta TaxID=7130 RepID=A0A922D0A0_MANSE|nr:hypothetical protein O3G_MSEX014577 [Manduca sexta]KAG6464525.1 hypothetical protein O3G_MSEX014577 [Manduca sexta]KAG6464526.1 hypothetical protein O3G_MSEX014577 [Manduca sexta]KAG6464527.1 hypothetical protein O3G_MSEX014577 [Manduca sexta]
MQEGNVDYLKRNMNDFDKVFRDLKNKGLLTFLNTIYLNGVYNVGLEYTSEAVEVLSVCKNDTPSAAMVVVHTDVHMLTCHKLVQYLGRAEDYTFIDIDYVCRVSPHTMDMIIAELTENDIPNVVIVCEDVSKYNIDDLIASCRAKKIILVTRDYAESEGCVSVRDDKINLTDLTDLSQTKILETKFVYQGLEVTFADVFDEGTKNLIDPKILQKIINKEQITLGETLEESTYNEIKQYYVPRSLKYNEKVYDNKDFLQDYTSMSLTTYDEYDDYNDTFCPLTLLDHREAFQNRFETQPHDIVLVLDTSGMGKSTLLTNLSLETKIHYPKIWIQRINLIDHTKTFKKWQDEGVEVNNEVALKFICNIGISKTINKDNVWTYKNIDFEIVNDEIKVIGSVEDDALLSFELRILLHCYKEGNFIFLFDGFDEICPMYSTEVTQLINQLSCFKATSNATVEGGAMPRSCAWITCRSYNDLTELLEDKFGKSYSLQPFTYADVSVFLDKYMKHNFSLNTISKEQLNNINVFFEYMKKFKGNANTMENGLTLMNLSLHSIYVAALRYFNSETKRTYLSPDLLRYVRNWQRQVSDDFFQDYRQLNDAFTLSGVPLHVYLAVNYFHDQIKNIALIDEDNAKQLWDLDANAFAFYEGFLETKLKNWLVEKNGLDISKTAVGTIFKNQRIEFRNNHKKLAFFAIFHERIHEGCSMHNVNKIIKDMERGEEHTGLVDRIINGVPKFVHYTFAEYFAVECILDFLKSDDWDEQKYMMDFILVHILSWSISGVLSILDLKLKFDLDLVKSVYCTRMYQFLFKCLVEQNKLFQPTEYIDEVYIINAEPATPHLDKVLQLGLPNLTDFFIKAVIASVNEKTLTDFIYLMDHGFFINKLFKHEYYDYGLELIECVRRINPKKNCSHRH